MNDSEKIDLLESALNQLLTSVECKTVTVGDCNQARNALRIVDEGENEHPLCREHAQFGVGS